MASAGFRSSSLIRAKPNIAALRLMAHRGTSNFCVQAERLFALGLRWAVAGLLIRLIAPVLLPDPPDLAQPAVRLKVIW